MSPAWPTRARPTRWPSARWRSSPGKPRCSSPRLPVPVAELGGQEVAHVVHEVIAAVRQAGYHVAGPIGETTGTGEGIRHAHPRVLTPDQEAHLAVLPDPV